MPRYDKNPFVKEIQHPSQQQHEWLKMEQEETWNPYYEIVNQEIDPQGI